MDWIIVCHLDPRAHDRSRKKLLLHKEEITQCDPISQTADIILLSHEDTTGFPALRSWFGTECRRTGLQPLLQNASQLLAECKRRHYT